MKNTSEKIFYILIFAIVIYAVIYSYINPENYTAQKEPLTWQTGAGFLLGAVVAFYRCYLLIPFRGKRFRLGLIIIGSLFLLGALEELSWGQYIFHFDSPTFFETHNAYGKTNFRDLVFYGAKINKIIFGSLFLMTATLYVFALPLIYKKYTRAKDIINSLALPVPQQFHIICYIFLLILAVFYQGHDARIILEFGGAWMFSLMILNPQNKEFFSRKTIR